MEENMQSNHRRVHLERANDLQNLNVLTAKLTDEAEKDKGLRQNEM